MPTLELIDLAAEGFSATVAMIADHGWSNPTPCTEWDVAALVDHVIGGNIFTATILGGAAAEDGMAAAKAVFTQGHDRVGLLQRSFADQRTAFSQAGVFDRTFEHAVGIVSGVQVVGFRIVDLTVHRWDLARGLGTDESIEPRLAEAAWSMIDPATTAATGLFGSGRSGDVPDDAPTARRLLDALGRRP